ACGFTSKETPTRFGSLSGMAISYPLPSEYIQDGKMAPCADSRKRPPEASLEITLGAIEDARRAVSGAILRTPMLPAPRLSAMTGAEVHIKYENLQVTGSFKERGALAKLASLPEPARAAGVIAMSAGNHAQAVAYHAARLNIPATIVMPAATPLVKVAATERYGAQVVL